MVKRLRMCLGVLLLLTMLCGCVPQTLPEMHLPWKQEPAEQPADVQPDEEPEPEPEPVEEPEPPEEEPEPLPESAEQTAKRAELLERARALADSCLYEEALALLDNAGDVRNGETEQLSGQIRSEQASLQPYEGPVYHVFFHSLIVDPARAFDGGASSEGYDLWMTTRDEFSAMLPQLEARGYMLVDYEDLITRNPDGTIAPAQLMLPPGKKPLVLSVDDVCYYQYMEGDGFAQRLALDENGDVVTIVDGQPTRDGDVVPILDDYVREHPGFSYRGAKGILAVTGYEGIFGYRITDLEGEALAQAQAEAKAVCDRLKETGWRIASHSYTHNGYFQDGSVTMEQLRSDTERWKTRIEPVTGPTNLYVSPFGMQLSFEDPRFAYLMEQGYEVYCPVSMEMRLKWGDGALIHERFNLDGYSMRNRRAKIEELFFSVEDVYDSARPTPLS